MAKKTPKVHTPEVLPAVRQDQQLISEDTTKLQGWLAAGVARFLVRAGELEALAKERLDVARQMKTKPPTTAEQDAKVQIELRSSKVARKQIDEHWTITQLVHQLHRRLTSMREIGGGMADESATILQGLHNRYVEDAQRAAREEQDRINREAEERARVDREKELARLEAEAVKVEANSPALSERETRFVELVASDLNTPTVAARAAGYKDPDVQADRLMKAVKIIAAIAAKRIAADVRKQADARRAMPLEVEVETVRPDVTRATPGGFDRATWSGEVLDAKKFRDAVFEGAHGIPRDVLMIDPTKLNEYARSMHEKMNVWPGVRAKKTTTTV
jgi:hypothetical protein